MFGCLFFFGDPHQDIDGEAADKELLRFLVSRGDACETCDRPEAGTCPNDPKDLRGPLQYNICIYHSAGGRALPAEEVVEAGGAN